MSTRMQVTHRFDADVESVYALLSDPAFVERRFVALGATEVSVTRSEAADGGLRLVARRRMTVDLPGFAKKVMTPTNTVIQTEDWMPADTDGRRACTYAVEVQGVPSRFDGTITLSPDGTGTRQDVDAEVKVSIPLLGGKLEKFAVDSGTTLIGDEAAFTAAELDRSR